MGCPILRLPLPAGRPLTLSAIVAAYTEEDATGLKTSGEV